MISSLRHYPAWDENAVLRASTATVIRYRFEFVGVRSLPMPGHVYRETPVVVGTVEHYGAQRFLVESVNQESHPPVAVLRKVRS